MKQRIECDLTLKIRDNIFRFMCFYDRAGNEIDRPAFIPEDITDENAFDRQDEIVELIKANGYEEIPNSWGIYDGELFVDHFNKTK